MDVVPESLKSHRVELGSDVVHGEVRWEPVRSLWFGAMALGALVTAFDRRFRSVRKDLQ